MSANLNRAAATLLVAGVMVALSTNSLGQNPKPSFPKYDAKTEVHIAKAVVQDVKEVAVGSSQRIVLNVKAGDELLDVYLSPKAFLDMMDTAFAKGDEVQITGSKVKDAEDKTIILAREVIKGDNTVVLRDKNGEPAWTWMEKKGAEGK